MLNNSVTVVVQMRDVFDNDKFIVGPYDWSRYSFLVQYVNYPDEYFRQVSSCSTF